jgi:hypothetical protein
VGPLIDHLATPRVRGAKLVLAYTVGLLFGVAVALLALLIAGTTP